MNTEQPTYTRLMEASRATFRIKNPNTKATNAAICRMLNISDQALSNWRSRGVPREAMVDLASKAGTSAEWIATGQHPNTRLAPVAALPHPCASVLDDLAALLPEDAAVWCTQIHAAAVKVRRQAGTLAPPIPAIKEPRSA